MLVASGRLVEEKEYEKRKILLGVFLVYRMVEVEDMKRGKY